MRRGGGRDKKERGKGRGKGEEERERDWERKIVWVLLEILYEQRMPQMFCYRGADEAGEWK